MIGNLPGGKFPIIPTIRPPIKMADLKRYFFANSVYILGWVGSLALIAFADRISRGGGIWQPVPCFGLVEAGPLAQYPLIRLVGWTESATVRWLMLAVALAGLPVINIFISTRRRGFLFLSLGCLFISSSLFALGVLSVPATPSQC